MRFNKSVFGHKLLTTLRTMFQIPAFHGFKSLPQILLSRLVNKAVESLDTILAADKKLHPTGITHNVWFLFLALADITGAAADRTWEEWFSPPTCFHITLFTRIGLSVLMVRLSLSPRVFQCTSRVFAVSF